MSLKAWTVRLELVGKRKSEMSKISEEDRINQVMEDLPEESVPPCSVNTSDFGTDTIPEELLTR